MATPSSFENLRNQLGVKIRNDKHTLDQTRVLALRVLHGLRPSTNDLATTSGTTAEFIGDSVDELLQQLRADGEIGWDQANAAKTYIGSLLP